MGLRPLEVPLRGLDVVSGRGVNGAVTCHNMRVMDDGALRTSIAGSQVFAAGLPSYVMSDLTLARLFEIRSRLDPGVTPAPGANDYAEASIVIQQTGDIKWISRRPQTGFMRTGAVVWDTLGCAAPMRAADGTVRFVFLEVKPPVTGTPPGPQHRLLKADSGTGEGFDLTAPTASTASVNAQLKLGAWAMAQHPQSGRMYFADASVAGRVRASSPYVWDTLGANDYIDLPVDGARIRAMLTWRDYVVALTTSEAYFFGNELTDAAGGMEFNVTRAVLEGGARLGQATETQSDWLMPVADVDGVLYTGRDGALRVLSTPGSSVLQRLARDYSYPLTCPHLLKEFVVLPLPSRSLVLNRNNGQWHTVDCGGDEVLPGGQASFGRRADPGNYTWLKWGDDLARVAVGDALAVTHNNSVYAGQWLDGGGRELIVRQTETQVYMGLQFLALGPQSGERGKQGATSPDVQGVEPPATSVALPLIGTLRRAYAVRGRFVRFFARADANPFEAEFYVTSVRFMVDGQPGVAVDATRP